MPFFFFYHFFLFFFIYLINPLFIEENGKGEERKKCRVCAKGLGSWVVERKKKVRTRKDQERKKEVFFFLLLDSLKERRKLISWVGDWQECGQLKRRETVGCLGCGVRFLCEEEEVISGWGNRSQTWAKRRVWRVGNLCIFPCLFGVSSMSKLRVQGLELFCNSVCGYLSSMEK